jgi:SAM-dependent methyltransferase
MGEEQQMEEYMRSNRRLWNDWTTIHEKSAFYDVEGFKAGRSSLNSVELDGVGDVSGKSLLHLQCHFGLDTLSWAQLGAKVTGVDFSERAIGLARSLGEELGIPARFICSNIYDLPEVLNSQFDVIFTSCGVLNWLPDLKRWAQVVFRFLKPGGTFYILEYHPFADVFDDEQERDLRVKYPYFPGSEPLRFEGRGSYADPEADYASVEYVWDHPLSEIVNSIVAAGLQIEHLNEFSYCAWRALPFMEKDEDGWWRLSEDRDGDIPFMFSLTATKEVTG